MPQTPILHALSAALGADGTPDAELLRRFAEAHDRTAFELLVRRHAELVWGVCRATLPHDPHAAEDAFQATFLALARRASSIRDASAAGWLFQVARNAATRARANFTRRYVEPLPDALAVPGPAADESAAMREVAGVVVEEVDRLDAKFRTPVVLCFFEGHTHEEAAARLGWRVGTVASRLARAKDVLRARLTRRGLALPAAGLATVFTAVSAGAAPLRPTLAVVSAQVRVPPGVLLLTEGVLSAMRFAQLKTAVAVVVLAVGLTVALAAVPRDGTSPPRADRAHLIGAKAVPDPPKEKPDPKELEAKDLKAFKGEWRVVRMEMPDKELTEHEMATIRMAFDGNDLQIRRGVEGGVEKSRIALAAAETPKHIDLRIVDKDGEPEMGQFAPGIYELKGDFLNLCFRPESEAKDRPTEFKGGKGQVFVVLERLKDEKEELKALQGEWKGVKMTTSGKDVPADEVAKMRLVFDGGDVQFTSADEKKKSSIKLDPAAVPPKIDLIVKHGQETRTELVGVYFRRENKLTICFADQNVKGAVRPTELKSGDATVYFVLERVPKK
jgi:RNA polymerase sigma factor (sigma-70 family)